MPDCKHAGPAAYQRWRYAQRDRPVMDAIRQHGMSPAAAAAHCGVSTRQIYRVVRCNRPANIFFTPPGFSPDDNPAAADRASRRYRLLARCDLAADDIPADAIPFPGQWRPVQVRVGNYFPPPPANVPELIDGPTYPPGSNNRPVASRIVCFRPCTATTGSSPCIPLPTATAASDAGSSADCWIRRPASVVAELDDRRYSPQRRAPPLTPEQQLVHDRIQQQYLNRL